MKRTFPLLRKIGESLHSSTVHRAAASYALQDAAPPAGQPSPPSTAQQEEHKPITYEQQVVTTRVNTPAYAALSRREHHTLTRATGSHHTPAFKRVITLENRKEAQEVIDQMNRAWQGERHCLSRASSESTDALDPDPIARDASLEKRRQYHVRLLTAIAQTALPALPELRDAVYSARNARENDCTYAHDSQTPVVYGSETQEHYQTIAELIKDQTVWHNGLLRQAMKRAVAEGTLTLDEVKQGGFQCYKVKKQEIRAKLHDVIMDDIDKLKLTMSDFPDPLIGRIVLDSLYHYRISGDPAKTWVVDAMQDLLTHEHATGTEIHHMIFKSHRQTCGANWTMRPSNLVFTHGSRAISTPPSHWGSHEYLHRATGYMPQDTVEAHMGGYHQTQDHFRQMDVRAVGIISQELTKPHMTKREAYALTLEERVAAYRQHATKQGNHQIARQLDTILHYAKESDTPYETMAGELQRFSMGQQILRRQAEADQRTMQARGELQPSGFSR